MKNRPDDEKHFTLHNPLYIIDYEMVIGVKSVFDTSHTLHTSNLLYYRYIQAFVKCEVFLLQTLRFLRSDSVKSVHHAFLGILM